MSPLSLLWVLAVSGHVLQVFSKKSTTLKKRQQVLRSAAGNFLLHLSPVKDDGAPQEEPSWGTRQVLLKSNENNDYDSQNGHLVKGHDLNKSKKIRLFSAEKHQTVLRNGVFLNHEILIDDGDEVWPKSEEEPEIREETGKGHLGRKVNFDGSHKEQFKNDELNPRQDDFPETKIKQVLHYEYGKGGSHETEAQTEITKNGLVGKESTPPASRMDGERQDTALPNVTNLKENVQKSFNNKSGYKSGLIRLKAPLDMQHITPKVDASLVNEPENSQINNNGTLHAKQNATLQYAFSPPEKVGFLSKTTTKMRFRGNSVDNANHGNMPDKLDTAEHENGSQNFDHISVPALESAEQHYRQQQRESDQDVHPENLLAQGFQQAEENTLLHARNQTMKIVYFVKMATGFPLHHDKPIHDAKQAPQRTSSNTLMSAAVQQEPEGNAQDVSESYHELEGTNRGQDEEALQKPPIPDHFHTLTQDLQRKEHQDDYHPPMSANVIETNKGMHDKNERQGEQVTRNVSITNFDHVSMQGLLKQNHGNSFVRLPLSTDLSETNKYMQGRKNENQDQQISHNSSVTNSDHFPTQGLLEQEKENEHRQPLSVDASKTNKDIQDVNGQNDHSNTAPKSNSDKVSMSSQNNITNLNTITTTMPLVPNMVVQPNFNPNPNPYPYSNPKPNTNASANPNNPNPNPNASANPNPNPDPNPDPDSNNPNPNPDLNPNPILYPYPNLYHNPNSNHNSSLLQEQGVQEPDILTDEPSVPELKSNENDEEGTVNSRQGTNSRPWGSNRFRNRYRNRNRNRNRYRNRYRNRRRPSGGNWGGGNTGGLGGAGQGGVTAPGNTGGPAGSPAPQTAPEFAEDALQAHNKYRQVHNADPMILDRDLSNQAQGYAQKIASMQSLTHSSNQERGDDVGENLAYACKTNGVPLTGSETTKMWYDEVCEYNFNRGGFNMNTGHFTQVVWKDSLDLGMGMAETSKDGMKCIYAVGRYRKAGNFGGQYSDKVTRGNFDQSYCNNVRN